MPFVRHGLVVTPSPARSPTFRDLIEDEAVQAAAKALVKSRLVLPDVAEAVAVVAISAANPTLWYRLQRRIDHLEDELGIPRTLP